MIEITAIALADLKRVQSFLEHQNPKAALDAVATITEAIDRLARFPHVGRPTDASNVRQHYVRFGRSGYVIRYVAEAEINSIVITRIWHSRETRD